MNQIKKQKLFDVYKIELEKEVTKNPKMYSWQIAELPTVVERMSIAFDRGSYSKDSNSWRNTCKKLGIKNTYKAIDQFVER